MLGWSLHSHSSRIGLAIPIIILVIVYQKAKNIRNNSFRGVALFGAMLNRTAKKDYVTYMDIQGIEPWTSRMRSVRPTTVPNALHRSILLPYVEPWLHSIGESNITSRVRTLPLSRATSREAAFEIGL